MAVINLKKVVESFPHGTLSYCACRIYGIIDLRHEIMVTVNGQKLRPDVSFRLGNTILIVEWKRNSNAVTALNEALYYRFKLKLYNKSPKLSI
jgi:hypothetical protein